MNGLTLAVAGGRKTQSVVDRCLSHPVPCRVLVLTYTLRNQNEISARLETCAPYEARVEVSGWFSFLLAVIVRPYLPTFLPGHRLQGLNFDGDPGQRAWGSARYLDASDRAYRRHLSKLAFEVCKSSNGAAIDRMCRMYDMILIDEVQDLNGYDLEILDLLFKAPIDVRLVGDVRQALFNTNVQDPLNRKYRGISIKNWFHEVEAKGLLIIEHSSETWRCSQQIADLADSIFPKSMGFGPTVSRSTETSDHEGIYSLAGEDAQAYCDKYDPLCLRATAASWKSLDLPFINIGVAKGMGANHVLIAPTFDAEKFLRAQTELKDGAACSLYVAITRARHSVAIVSKKPDSLPFPQWVP